MRWPVSAATPSSTTCPSASSSSSAAASGTRASPCETFNPLGPWLVTADEVADPQNLGLRLWVNGEPRQDGNTKNMAFGVAEIVRYLSQFMVLDPGDVINTGTPAGVALGQPEPKPYLPRR